MKANTANKFCPEVRARAVRMVLDHEGQHPSRWAAISSIAAKIGCTAQTLNEWVKKAEVESGTRAGVPSEVAERLKTSERENRELRQANDILRKASAYFAMAELDRWFKPGSRLSMITGGLRDRADLPCTADRPVHLPRSCSQAARSGQTVGSGAVRRRTGDRGAPGVCGKLPCLWRA
jgi:transposase-like protein